MGLNNKKYICVNNVLSWAIVINGAIKFLVGLCLYSKTAICVLIRTHQALTDSPPVCIRDVQRGEGGEEQGSIYY